MSCLREVLVQANQFRKFALELHDNYQDFLRNVEIITILEKDTQKIIAVAKEGKVKFGGKNGALKVLLLKKKLLELQKLFYDFSPYIEPIDLITYLERNEYRYIMTKARENNEEISSACRIGNIMFSTTIRNVVIDNDKWGLMVYRIKKKWRKENIKRVV